jgi:hypothetical protein
MNRAAVGVANHNGWAHLVTVSLDDGAPAVLDRRRVALVSPDLPSQPYHHEAVALPLAKAQALVTSVRASAGAHARDAFATLAADLSPRHRLIAAAIRESPFGNLPSDLAEVLAYPPFIYAADAMLYLETLGEAARAIGLALVRHAKGEEFTLAAAVLRVAPSEAEEIVRSFGRALGPPWSQEHQRAAAAAVGALA